MRKNNFVIWQKKHPRLFRRNYSSRFHNSEFQRKVGSLGGKAIVKIRRKDRIPFFTDKARERGGKHGGATTIKRYGGWYGVNVVLKKNNPEKYAAKQLKASKAGMKSHRENKPYWYFGVPFDSNLERNIAKEFHKKYNFIPKERINCHIVVDRKEFDFVPFKRKKIIIDYHPWDRGNKTPNQYYKERRKILNENGYKNWQYIVLRNLL